MSGNGNVTLTIDGTEVTVPKGTNLIEAARRLGTHVPHYCYHPALSVVGNCRICLVEVEGMPKLQIACNTEARDGMVMHTRNERVEKGREGVMEFLLINHPLDCTICDQAGECKLQDYAFHNGAGVSRFEDEKVHKPKNVSWGDLVVFDSERCILCTLCVRFLDEVAGTDEVSIDARGDQATLIVKADGKLTSPYQMNIIDICPVGALTSRDFRFKSRLWFMQFADTICTSCARGCNTTVGVRDERVLRMVPRHNADVNGDWMCDHGRLHFAIANDDERLSVPRVDGRGVPYAVAAQRAADLLREAGDSAAAVASPFMTNEELHVLKLICDATGIEKRLFLNPVGPGDELLVHSEKSPNARGAALLGFEAVDQDCEGVQEIDVLLYVTPREGIALPETVEARAKRRIVFAFHEREADVLFPLTSWIEKDGTVVSAGDRVQRLVKGLSRFGSLLTERAALEMVLQALDRGFEPAATPAQAFERVAAALVPFEGLTFTGVGAHGAPLGRQEVPA